MRLGLSTNFNEDSAEKWAKKMVSLGCKSVVFPLNCEASDSQINEYVEAAKANDLLIAEVGIWRNALDPDDDARKKNLEYSIKQLALADKIGARCAVNVAGSFGARWDGGYKENFSVEMLEKTVEMVRTVIDEAKPKNTYFSLEPMPWMVPTGPKEYQKLIEAVDRDRFGVHMDIINMINCPTRYFFPEEFLEETFETLGDKIKSCHLKDVKLLDGFTFQLQECACGEGVFPIEKYIDLADKYDVDMPMIIEHLSSDDEYIKNIAYVSNRINTHYERNKADKILSELGII
ncbi:MAG: sugar phosphate isomerase/epimerase [Lachnospiraceae bacterium]|nr:sugar phosphate isomerase/epimerase [Lachnospiraceae bacterium]